MHTRPLPLAVSRLFWVSYFLILCTFIFSMVNTGWFSLFIIPGACLLTAIYHVTLVVLSRSKVGPPPLTQATIASPINQSRTSVYRPASLSNPDEESNELPTIQERHTYTSGTVYPSYTISVVNCTVTFLLAFVWAMGSWIPIFKAAGSENNTIPRHRVPPYLEGALGYCESIVLFWLFGLFVQHRKKQLQNKEFIRMDN